MGPGSTMCRLSAETRWFGFHDVMSAAEASIERLAGVRGFAGIAATEYRGQLWAGLPHLEPLTLLDGQLASSRNKNGCIIFD